MLPEYYLGLDVGTNSVGYAVTDESYRLLKFRNEPMWGAHVFDEALSAADRRMKRTGKRRLQRRQQRVLLVQEIFAHEVAKTDERFFVRLREATRFRDELSPTEANILFNDADFHDKDYYGTYPTIHHLLMALIEDKVPTDTRYARLVYLAVGWLVAHRGHFLSDVDKDNFQEVLDFHGAYREFLGWMEKCGLQPWDCNEEDLQQELLKESRVRDKEKALGRVLYGGKAPKASEDAPVDEGKLVALLAGGSVKIKKLFPAREYEEDASLSFHDLRFESWFESCVNSEDTQTDND